MHLKIQEPNRQGKETPPDLCTTGALAVKQSHGEGMILLGKTIDFYKSSLWFGKLQDARGYTSLGCGLTPQLGVNSGVNEKGLGVLLSYIDYRGPFEKPNAKLSGQPMLQKWADDERGLMNAQILAKCSSVEEGIDLLYALVAECPNTPGGNHMLVDCQGTIAVFEHCNGEAKHKYYDNFAARGNNGLLVRVQEQTELPAEIILDREIRYRKMNNSMRELLDDVHHGLSESEAVMVLKSTLSSHTNGNGLGSVCCHDLDLPGGRSSSHLSLSTLTGVILDVGQLKMHYSIGSPCRNNWEVLSL